MGDEQKIIYFFDDIINFISVAEEVFELYADYIIESKFMHAQIEDLVFKEEEKNHLENFMKVVKGEEPTESEPGKSMKHILSLSLGKNAPIDEINECLRISGGWIKDYNDEWYETNVIEEFTYVSDKTRVMDVYKRHMRNMIKMAGD